MPLLIVLLFLLNLVLLPIIALLGLWATALASLLALLATGYLIFKDSMNLVQRVGRVYWIVRDNGTPDTPWVASGFMRMTSAPWLVGSGVQFRFRRHTLQIGLCSPQPVADETEGVLNAVGGRYMDDAPEEIGVWR